MLMNRSRCACVLLSGTILVIAIAVLCFLFFKSQEGKKQEAEDWKAKYAATFKQAAVSSDAAQCSHVGVRVLRDTNGSAVDAAIAAWFCMGLVTPESLGLGGGSCITVFHKETGNVTVVSGRETAAAYAAAGMFAGIANKSDVGVDAIAVPGDLAALFKVHQLFGKTEFPLLIQPTIDMARNGFEVGFHLGNAIKLREEKMTNFSATNLMRLLTNNETSDYYRTGDTMKRLDLAATLQVIQTEGRDALYSENGTIAKLLLRDLQEQGSRITIHDLVGYEASVEHVTPRVLPNGMNLFAPGLPSSGPVLGFIVETVMRIFNESMPLDHTDIDLYNRYVIEAIKFAYGQRGFLEDLDFDNKNNRTENATVQALSMLQSHEFSEKVANFIQTMNQTIENVAFYQNFGKDTADDYTRYRKDEGTAGLVVVDRDGNAVAIGGTVNAYFGSYVVSPRTGIILNNEMDDFSNDWINTYFVAPSPHNKIAAGKRPFSSIAPCVVTSGRGEEQELEMAMAASGGTQITTSEAMIALRSLLFRNVSLQQAVREARIHHQLQPNELKFENESNSVFPAERLQVLRHFGHKVTPIVGRGSVVMAIRRKESGELEAVTDWRKRGSVDGF